MDRSPNPGPVYYFSSHQPEIRHLAQLIVAFQPLTGKPAAMRFNHVASPARAAVLAVRMRASFVKPAGSPPVLAA